MSELNPYESPREGEPLTTGQVVKRGIGAGLILMLTPIAAFSTFFVTCCFALQVTGPWEIIGPPGEGEPSEAAFWAITLVPTLSVAAAMIVWAVRAAAERRNQ